MSGELEVRGRNLMVGYLDDASATRAVVDDDGWFRTGDVGLIDDAGYVSITDRIKNMFTVGGFNVYPAEVENALARLDGVHEVAVLGIADERLGAVGRAYVVRAPGATRPGLEGASSPSQYRFRTRGDGGSETRRRSRSLATARHSMGTPATCS